MKIVPLDRQRLAEHGVDLVKAGGHWMLVCQQCGAAWPVPSHIISRSYWICPAFWCNAETRPAVRKKARPKPEPEPEPTPDHVVERELEYYRLMREAAGKAKTEEARQRFEAQAQRHLGQVERMAPAVAAGERFEETFDGLTTQVITSDRHWLDPDELTAILDQRGHYLDLAAKAKDDEERARLMAEADRCMEEALKTVEVENGN